MGTGGAAVRVCRKELEFGPSFSPSQRACDCVVRDSAASGEEEEVWDRPSSHCFLNVPSKVMEKMSLSPFSQRCHGGSDLSCLRICVEVTGTLGADGFTGSGWLRVYGVR